MVCKVYKILLMSSVAVLLFVQSSTSSPVHDRSMVVQPRMTSTDRRHTSSPCCEELSLMGEKMLTNNFMNSALEKENTMFKEKIAEQEEEIAKLRKRLQIEDDLEIYPETEKPSTGSENDFMKSKNALRIGKKLVSKTFSKDDRIMLDQQNHFEGDILMEGSKIISRAGVLRKSIWPNKTIPYEIIKGKYDKEATDLILEAMQSIQNQTCIRFINRTTEKDFVHIYPDNGCFSNVGKIGGRQYVSLGQGCVDLAVIKHELMHAIGFFHEQSRTDRDEYVIIHYDNIKENYQYAFDKYDEAQGELRTPYDYSSIMHYGPSFFAKNFYKRTISAKGDEDFVVGLSEDFTETDILDINRLYQCRKNGLGEYVYQR